MKKKSRRPRARLAEQETPISRELAEAATVPSGAARPPSSYFKRQPLSYRLWIAVVAGLFLLTRLPGLAGPGLQYDEATYLYWGQVIGLDWSQRYIGAGWGGKQPLHAWLIALSEKLWTDPVFAGRLVSVAAGALTLAAILLLAERLYSRRVAVFAALLYVICPFMLIYDRLAMIDSLLAAEALWFVYLSVRLVDRLEPAAIIGMATAFGAALLTKSVGQAFPLLLPASLLAANPRTLDLARAKRWLLAVIIALAGGLALYYVAFGASDASKLISQFEKQYGQYTLPLSELLTFPWQRWQSNAGRVVEWFRRSVTIPLSLASIVALVAIPWSGRRAWLLGVWVVLPIMGQVAIASVFYDRYILFSIPPLLILVTRLAEQLYERASTWGAISSRIVFRWPLINVLSIAALVLFLLVPIAQSWTFLTQLNVANQTVGGFYGLQGARDYLVERSKTNPVYAIVNYSPSPVEDGLAVLVSNIPNIKTFRVAPINSKLTILDPLARQGYPKTYFDGKEVYYVWGENAETQSWLAGRVELVRSFPNMRGDDTYVGVYRIRFDEAFQ